MLRALELSDTAHRRLMDRATRRGLMFLSTPFDVASAEFLERLGMPMFKVSSGEITNLGFLRHLAAFGRPMMLSTGMSTLAEVGTAVRAIRGAGNPPLALLHCVSSYPADAKDANLRAMETLRRRFRLPVGFSDHTLGISVATAAVALGASIIEKHLTLSCRMTGPDHAASLEPDMFAAMVTGIREVEQSLGSGLKVPTASERAMSRVARRSLVTTTRIVRGTKITKAMLTCKRPGTGLAPAEEGRVVGRQATRTLPPDHLLRRSDFS
jgi:sialic acid synthase SpsE